MITFVATNCSFKYSAVLSLFSNEERKVRATQSILLPNGKGSGENRKTESATENNYLPPVYPGVRKGENVR